MASMPVSENSTVHIAIILSQVQPGLDNLEGQLRKDHVCQAMHLPRPKSELKQTSGSLTIFDQVQQSSVQPAGA